MKTAVVTILIALVGIAEINAQIIQPEKDELSIKQELLQETKPESNLLIQQINGAGNAFLTAEQELDFNNKAIINQAGLANTGGVFQTGKAHATRLHQTGAGNEANLFSTGNFTKLEVNQTGNNNSIFSNLSNNTLQLYSAILEQTGNSNTIELTLLSSNEIPGLEPVVSITQTGNDLNFSFSKTYDSPDLPISIEQKSGVNGQGMNVNVTTSAFYFPLN